jgi:hypothetical protein
LHLFNHDLSNFEPDGPEMDESSSTSSVHALLGFALTVLPSLAKAGLCNVTRTVSNDISVVFELPHAGGGWRRSPSVVVLRLIT